MSTNYKLYNLEDEIKKYSNENSINTIEQINQHNKHKVRDEFLNLLLNNIYMSPLEATDLEIGIFKFITECASIVRPCYQLSQFKDN